MNGDPVSPGGLNSRRPRPKIVGRPISRKISPGRSNQSGEVPVLATAIGIICETPYRNCRSPFMARSAACRFASVLPADSPYMSTNFSAVARLGSRSEEPFAQSRADPDRIRQLVRSSTSAMHDPHDRPWSASLTRSSQAPARRPAAARVYEGPAIRRSANETPRPPRKYSRGADGRRRRPPGHDDAMRNLFPGRNLACAASSIRLHDVDARWRYCVAREAREASLVRMRSSPQRLEAPLLPSAGGGDELP